MRKPDPLKGGDRFLKMTSLTAIKTVFLNSEVYTLLDFNSDNGQTREPAGFSMKTSPTLPFKKEEKVPFK